MRQSDRPRLSDIPAALRLLSRLPLPPATIPPRPNSAWAWPVAGAVLGGLAAAGGIAALPLGAGVAAALVLGLQAMLTGAMHEDGLADSADGLWGGWDRPRRLSIMKDSHIGTYGVMALIVVTLIRWSAVSALLVAGQWSALIAVAALSRVPMAVLMAVLPNARGTGLSASVGRPDARVAAITVLVGLGIAGVMSGGAALGMALAVLIAGVATGWVARAKIGGQTGDILGASQQLAEAAALAVAAATLAV